MAKKRVERVVHFGDEPTRVSAPARSRSSTLEPTREGSSLTQLALVAWPAAVVAGVIAAILMPCDSVSVALGLALPQAMYWLVVGIWGAAISIVYPQQFRWTKRSGWFVVAWVALLLWCSLSVWTNFQNGNARFELNVLWQWFATASMSLCTAGLFAYRAYEVLGNDNAWRSNDVRDNNRKTAILWLLLIIGSGLALHAMYQFCVTMPADRYLFETKPNLVLREAGVEGPPGSPAYQQFWNRLYSNEPYATFSLANSLAAVLAAALVLSAGAILPGGYRGETKIAKIRTLAVLSVLMLLMLAAFVLTKSRAAWIGWAVGLMILLGMRWYSGAIRLHRSIVVVSVIGACALGGLIYWGYQRDPLVFTEATKSLTYRVEYWRATLAMIADHPIFGVGVGNFQSNYTQYKLPEASESVADPHNWFLESAAVVGLPGVVLTLLVLVVALSGVWRGQARTSSTEFAHETPFGSEERKPDRTLLAGVVAGIVLAVVVGLPFGMIPDFLVLALACVLGAIAWWLGRSLITVDSFKDDATLAAAVAMLVSLSAAGGWFTPGIMAVLCALFGRLVTATQSVAYVDNPVDEGASSREEVGERLSASDRVVKDRSRWFAGLVAGVFALGMGGLVWTTWQPVLSVKTALSNPATRSQPEAMQKLTEMDPFDPSPRQMWAEYQLRRAMDRNGNLEAFESAIDRWLAADPANANAYRQAGDWWWIAAVTGRICEESVAQSRAAELYSKAIVRYPNDAGLRLQLAVVYFLQGDRQRATAEAEQAKALDQGHSHLDRKLSAQRTVWPRFPYEQWRESPNQGHPAASQVSGGPNIQPVRTEDDPITVGSDVALAYLLEQLASTTKMGSN